MATSPHSVMPRKISSHCDEFVRARFRDWVYDAVGDLADIRARLNVARIRRAG